MSAAPQGAMSQWHGHLPIRHAAHGVLRRFRFHPGPRYRHIGKFGVNFEKPEVLRRLPEILASKIDKEPFGNTSRSALRKSARIQAGGHATVTATRVKAICAPPAQEMTANGNPCAQP
jgi:hypothetical protein